MSDSTDSPSSLGQGRSAEDSATLIERAPLIDESWRERRHEAQCRALPHGRVVVSAPEPLDSGGLGRHLRELHDALERAGEPHALISMGAAGSAQAAADAADAGAAAREGGDVELGPGALWKAFSPLARTSRAWRMWAQASDFDRAAARRLPRGEHLIAFNGAALEQLRAARRRHWESQSLVSATAHFATVVRQHRRAYERHPIERPWAPRLLRRNLAEYEQAQRIYVSTEYARDSFISAGHPPEQLVRFPLTPHPRFRPSPPGAPPPASDSTFDVVFSGALTVDKGVPVLIDAVRALPHDDLRLVLVGGWSTRAMRRYLEQVCDADRRIVLAPGDPLPHLLRARLYAHPAYQDGFGYAPAEALACGVPVIVTEDTGMKELIDDGRNGVVVPTGEPSALAEAIAAAYRGELFRG